MRQQSPKHLFWSKSSSKVIDCGSLVGYACQKWSLFFFMIHKFYQRLKLTTDRQMEQNQYVPIYQSGSIKILSLYML